MGMRFPSEVMQVFLDEIGVMVTKTVNVLNATELSSLKWFILCYVRYTSIFFKKKPRQWLCRLI